MKKVILLVVIAVFVLTPALRADIVYAVDSSRTELNNGTDSMADTVRSDGSKLSVRGDAKGNKSWVEFDLTGVDVSALTSAELRLTLYEPKSGTCLVSAINDDVTAGLVALDGSLTWNNAPGNITSADGVNPDDGSFSVGDLQDNLDPALTTLVGTIDYTDGVEGQQYSIDVLSILQADTDGIVLFALHGSSGYMNWCTHDQNGIMKNGTDVGPDAAHPALVLVPEPATMLLLGLGGLMAVRRKR